MATITRRVVICATASAFGILFGAGASAGETDLGKVVVGTNFPEGFVPAGGPRVTGPVSEPIGSESDLGLTQNAELHPPRLEDQSYTPGLSMEKIRIDLGTQKVR